MKTNLSNVVTLAAELSQINCPSFVSILNYKNKQGEISNYVLNLGVSVEKAKEHDTLFLMDDVNFDSIVFPEGLKPYALGAWREMQKSHGDTEAGENNHTNGQTDAYVTVCPNIRVHKDSQRVFVYGFHVSKTVLVPGVYKKVNSSGNTLAKNHIRKYLRVPSFRQMAFDTLQSVKIKGEEIEISVF